MNDTLGPTLDYEDAQLLWDLDVPSKPELLGAMLAERSTINGDELDDRARQLDRSIVAFMKRNRIGGIVAFGKTFTRKPKTTEGT